MEDNKTPAMSVIIPKIITATLSGKKKNKKKKTIRINITMVKITFYFKF